MVSTDFDKRNPNLIVAGKTGGDNSVYVILKSESVLSCAWSQPPMTWLFWLMLNIYQWRVLHMVITFLVFRCFPKYCWFWSPAWLGHCGVVLHSSCVIQSVLLKTWKTFSPHVCNESWQRTWQNVEKTWHVYFPNQYMPCIPKYIIQIYLGKTWQSNHFELQKLPLLAGQ